MNLESRFFKMRIISIVWKRFLSHNNVKKLVVAFKKETKDGYDKKQFVDSKVIRVFGGNGGDGNIALLKLFCNPIAGPCGGDGGNGGHVIVRASSETLDLRKIASSIKASNGGNGMGKEMDGIASDHEYIDVPVGTLVTCLKSNKLLCELNNDEDIFIAARGGQGGKGNKFFLSQEHNAPTIAERGGNGEVNQILLEVKLLADIGLVGIPNAGKSSLLRALTRARPKVAPYAFTTLKPHIGYIEFEDKRIDPITVCDIPGIIEDSHINRGLGLEFLRHIERCRFLAFILDLNNCPIDQYCMILNELHHYRPILLSLPRLIICNKMDLSGTRAEFEDLKKYLLSTNDKSETIAISALYSSNINKIVMAMKEMKDKTTDFNY